MMPSLWVVLAGLLRSRAHKLTAEPVFESGRADGGVAVGHERAFSKRRSVITRVWICDHCTSVVSCTEVSADELVQAKLLRTSHLDHAVQWCSDGDPDDLSRDILCRHGLNQDGCESH